MAKPEKNLEQTLRIKGLLARRGESITSLSLRLGEPFGSVANNIYGYRSNQKLRNKIAGFLGRPVEELFAGGDGEAQHA